MSLLRLLLAAALWTALLLASGFVFGIGFSLSARGAESAPLPAPGLSPVVLPPTTPAPAPRASQAVPAPAMTGVPAPSPAAAPPVATAAPAATGTRAAPTVRPADRKPSAGALWAAGTASWGYGWAGVVTRLPGGTRIRVCGPLGCWSGRSVGYGPALWTHRVADLSRAVFSLICGDPGIGLCRVRVEVP